MISVNALLRKPHDTRGRRADHQAAARLLADAVDNELDAVVVHLEAIRASLRRIRARIDAAAPWVDWPDRLKSVILFLALPAVAFAFGMMDGKISGDDWNALVAAFSGSAAMTIRRADIVVPEPQAQREVVVLRARVVLLEAENGRLRAKLNDPRYLLRRGLALLSSHRGATLGLAATSAAFLVVAPGIRASAWERIVVPVAASYHAPPIHRRPAISPPNELGPSTYPVASDKAVTSAPPPSVAQNTQEVINDRGNDDAQGADMDATELQRGRHPLLERPAVDRPENGSGGRPAQAGRQRIPSADVRAHTRPVVPGMDGRADLP